MKLLGAALRSLAVENSRKLQCSHMFRALSTNAALVGEGHNNNQNDGPAESEDIFLNRIMDGVPGNSSRAFFNEFNKYKTRRSSGVDSNLGGASGLDNLGFGEGFSSLNDGMEKNLKEAAQYFEFDIKEIEEDPEYSFRHDMNLTPGMTYEPKDLDLRRPGVWKPSKQVDFEVTTAEVLKKADFRNVRFLSNFLTEAGIIIKRSKTGISAKAQRKIAREIKTARSFGLLPFTTMGTKAFVVGKSMENLDDDYEYVNFDNPSMDPTQDPLGQ